MALPKTSLSTLKLASQSGVKSCLSRLGGQWQNSCWLDPQNAYRTDCIGALKRDKSSSTTGKVGWAPCHSDLGEYIAASTIIHCFDGWSYLGRAIGSELAGDPDIARHLGYYAELRAAMSILAAGGIGVFDHTHVVIDAKGSCHKIEGAGGTHKFAWESLEHWAETQDALALVLGSIYPDMHSLDQWLKHYPVKSKAIAASWFKRWGLDLRRLADDREARNMSSYRPTAFTSPGPRHVRESIETMRRYWQVWEPRTSGGFPLLDKHLLRIGIDRAFYYSQGRSRRQAPKRYRQFIDTMLNSITPTEWPESEWKKFLNFESCPDVPLMLQLASGTSKPGDLSHSAEVIARAGLLLRVASGSAANMLQSVGAPGSQALAFWSKHPSVRRLLWAGDSAPSTCSDLWIDLRDAIESIDDWMDQSTSVCHNTAWKEHGWEMAALGTTERVALWGLGL